MFLGFVLEYTMKSDIDIHKKREAVMAMAEDIAVSDEFDAQATSRSMLDELDSLEAQIRRVD